jgi:hypothetical protein
MLRAGWFHANARGQIILINILWLIGQINLISVSSKTYSHIIYIVYFIIHKHIHINLFTLNEFNDFCCKIESNIWSIIFFVIISFIIFFGLCYSAIIFPSLFFRIWESNKRVSSPKAYILLTFDIINFFSFNKLL